MSMHLTDCFMDLIAYVVYFQKNVAARQPPFEQVKADVMRLVSESDTSAKKSSVAPDEYDQGRFAVCAWVDEMLLSSQWQHKVLWQREQLQRIYYNTTEAGEEIFERLNRLGLHQRDVREVYYLCLALGFKGRFIHAGDEFLLEQVKASNLKLLMGSSIGLPSLDKVELFPGSYPLKSPETISQKHRFRFSLMSVAVIVGPILIFTLLYLIYWLFLNSIAGKTLRMG